MSDNSWYERGELPPVGVECEFFNKKTYVWCHGKVIAYNGLGAAWLEGEGIVNCESYKSFRPIKSDREKAIDAIEELWKDNPFLSLKDFFSKAYDAGLLKLTSDNQPPSL